MKEPVYSMELGELPGNLKIHLKELDQEYKKRKEM